VRTHQTAHGRSSSSDRVILGVLLLLGAIIWLPRLDGPIDLRWDAGAYYVLGTSLAEGRGYRLLNEPGNIEAIQYPPGLPIVIAIHQLVLGTSDPHRVGHLLRFTCALIFIAFILTTYLMFKRCLPTAYAFLAALIVLVNPTTIVISDFCLSDLPFALIVALFFLLQRRSNRRIVQVCIPLIAIAAYTMRTTGLALLAAWVTAGLLDRRKKQATFRLALSLLPVLGWQYYMHRVESGPQFQHPAYQYQRADYMYYNSSYARNTSLVAPFVPRMGHLTPVTITRRVVHNLIRMPRTLGETVSARLDYWKAPFQALGKDSIIRRAVALFIYLVPIALGSLILGGIALQLRRRQWLSPFYILFSLTIICLTPFTDMFTRYMIPLTPFVALSLFEAVIWLKRKSERAPSREWRAAGYFFVALVTCFCLLQAPFYLTAMYTRYHQQVAYHDRQGRLVEYRLFFYDEPCRALDAGIDWLNSHAHPSDIVAVSMPHWVYLRTGLKTVMPPFEPDSVRVEALLDSVPVNYVVLDATLYGKPADTTQYVAPVVRSAPDRWERRYSGQRESCEIYQPIRRPESLPREGE
jgi:4-amino-4-deoxy-L-arabinose transferase-like glycosyltransferase